MSGAVTTINTETAEGAKAMREALGRLGAPRNRYEAAQREKARRRGLELRNAPSEERAAIAARHRDEDHEILVALMGRETADLLRERWGR